jgi:membrane protein
MDVQKLYEQSRDYLFRSQWETDLSEVPAERRRGRRWLRIITLAAAKFYTDRCLTQAATLTLVVLFSLAPTLAVGFAMAKGFGVQSKVRTVIYQQLQLDDTVGNPAAAQIRTMIDPILDYVDQTHVQALGIVAFLIMVYTAWRVLLEIELSLNTVWLVEKQRPFVRQIVDYLAVIVVMPIMLTVAVLLSAFLEASSIKDVLTHLLPWWAAKALIRLATFVAAGIGLWFLYFSFPNTRVPFRAALAGAVVGSIFWIIVQWVFVKLQIGVVNYNRIYGTFAAVPIFLLWLQFSWWVILFGAEVSYAYARHRDYEYGGIGFRPELELREELALGAAAVVARAYIREHPAPGYEEIARELHAPVVTIREIMHDLVAGKVVVHVQGPKAHFLPAAPPDRITLLRVIKAAHGQGVRQAPAAVPLEALGIPAALRARRQLDELANRATLLDLVTQAEGDKGPKA